MPGLGLTGRLALVLAAGLLVAQAINGVLLTQAEGRLAEARAEAVATRLILRAAEVSETRIGRRLAARRARGGLVSAAPPPAEGKDRPAAAERLAAAFGEAGIAAEETAARLTERPAGSGPGQALVLSARTQRGWISAAVPVPRPAAAALLPIALQTLVIYAVVLVPLLFAARVVTEPLRRLAVAMRRYPAETPPLGEAGKGPADVAALAAAFEEMRERIERLFAERDAMLGAIAHDLRTPLTSLRLRTEEIADERLRAKMAASVTELGQLLDDALALAQAGRPEEERARADLHALAQGVIATAQEAGQKAEAGRMQAVEAPVYRSALARALSNLVSNADRHAGGGRVSVYEVAGQAWLSVEDDGPGLPRDRMTALTSAFARGEGSRSRRTGGAGLGLAIAERIALLHGGRLVLENKPEGGFLAALVLPAGQTPKKPLS